MRTLNPCCIRVIATLLVCSGLGLCLTGANAGTVYTYNTAATGTCKASELFTTTAFTSGQCAITGDLWNMALNITCETHTSDSAWTVQAWTGSHAQCGGANSLDATITLGTGRACVTAGFILSSPLVVDCGTSTPTAPVVPTNSLVVAGMTMSLLEDDASDVNASDEMHLALTANSSVMKCC